MKKTGQNGQKGLYFRPDMDDNTPVHLNKPTTRSKQMTREERIAKAEAEAEQAWREEQAAFEARYRQVAKTER